MLTHIAQSLKENLQLSFEGIRNSLESTAKLLLIALEVYAVYWVFTQFDWQPVLPVYQWY